MTIIKIPKEYLINQDQKYITLDLPDNFLITETKSIDYDKIAQVRGILKQKHHDFLIYSQKVRQEWE